MKRHLAAHCKEFGRVAPLGRKRDAFTGGDLLTRAGDCSAISFTLAPASRRRCVRGSIGSTRATTATASRTRRRRTPVA